MERWVIKRKHKITGKTTTFSHLYTKAQAKAFVVLHNTGAIKYTTMLHIGAIRYTTTLQTTKGRVKVTRPSNVCHEYWTEKYLSERGHLK